MKSRLILLGIAILVLGACSYGQRGSITSGSETLEPMDPIYKQHRARVRANVPIAICRQENYRRCLSLDKQRCDDSMYPVSSLCLDNMSKYSGELTELNATEYSYKYTECLVDTHVATVRTKNYDDVMQCLDQNPFDKGQFLEDLKRY